MGSDHRLFERRRPHHAQLAIVIRQWILRTLPSAAEFCGTIPVHLPPHRGQARASPSHTFHLARHRAVVLDTHRSSHPWHPCDSWIVVARIRSFYNLKHDKLETSCTSRERPLNGP